jgi:CO/xanthine dehydrogenase Mo-binding subunit
VSGQSERPRRSVVGQPRRTLESARLVRGAGRYVGNLQLPGMLHVALVRSPHAHALVRAVDVHAAEQADGVHAVLTGAQAAQRCGPLFTLAALHDPPLAIPVRALAAEKVHYVGDPVVAIAAESRAQAEDATELVQVQYQPLPAVLDAEAALREDAPRLHEDIPGNVIMRRHLAFGPVEESFARAAHVVARELRWSRQTAAPLETFGCVAHWQADGELVIHSNHQSHVLLWTLAASLGIPAGRLRGVPCDIGGAFGAKFWQPRPLAICALLSQQTGRPVRFLEDRRENLEAGENHGEERVYRAELALDRDGRMLALRLRSLEDYGWAFVLGPINNSEPLAQATGPYAIDALSVDFTAVVTNKTAQAAYRGFGGAAQNFMLERLVDAAAAQLGLPRAELRRRNLIAPERFPYRTPTGNVYDSGRYPEALERALALGRVEHWREVQRQARGEGRAIGIGLVCCQERSVQGGTALWVMFDQKPGRVTTAAETASCRIDGQGQVRIALHSPSLGTPTETVAATVAAEELGVDPEQVVVTRLDTSLAGPALGPSASRMTVMLAGAVAGAVREVIEKMRTLAAHLLEAAPEDLDWDRSRSAFAVRGAPTRAATLHDIAHLANSQALSLPPGARSGLEATFTYDHPYATMPKPDGSDWGVFCPVIGHAVHVPVVEVDTDTGEVRFLDYAVVHDCGTVLNPAAVRGQIIGGICQGIASALSEQLRYGPDGRLVERDLRSYYLPTFLEMPNIRLEHLQTPSPFTYMGVKGVGEGGRMCAPAAVVSAIEDALAPWGVAIDEVPVTPEKILRWLGRVEGRA